MAILNATTNSFYAPSRLKGNVIERVERALDEGAEIVDIGGQSTAPNSPAISQLEESGIIIPIVEQIKAKYPSVILSVDTFYGEVARQALSVGADMINDVSGLADQTLAVAVAEFGASLCIMHNRRNSKVHDLWLDKESGLLSSAQTAIALGVPEERIILDGGVGFNKSAAEDWQLVKNYDRLSDLGFQLLLGTSRKSFLGGEPETRLSATLDTTATAVSKGILFVRVHDVKENKMLVDSMLK